MGKLGPYLVGPSGDQAALHQCQAIAGGQHPVVRPAGFAPGLGGVGDKDPVFLGILEKKPNKAPLLFGEGPLYNGEVPLVNLPVPDFLIQDPQSFGGLGGDDDATGVPVNTVAQGGGEGVFLPGPPFFLLVQIGLDLVNEGPAVFRPVVGVDGQPGPFVHQEDVFILVNDIELGGGYGEIGVILPGFVEKLVVDIQRQHIPRLEPGVPFCPGAVQLDPLDADVFLGKGSRKQGDRLGKKPVQPLPGVVLPDGQLFHMAPAFFSKWRLI